MSCHHLTGEVQAIVADVFQWHVGAEGSNLGNKL